MKSLCGGKEGGDMKVLRKNQFRGRDLYERELNHNDLEHFCNIFSKIESDTFEILCDWLKDNNKTVVTKDCYDGGSGWFGTDFMIGKANLSLNGYCLSDKSILDFVSGLERCEWYNFYDEEYKAIKLKQNNTKKV